jgi:hypothetical protein
MTVRQRKKALAFSAAILGVLALLVLVVGLSLPARIAAREAEPGIDVPGADDAANDAQAEAAAAEASRQALAELQRLCRADLRRPLYDPPSAAGPSPGGPTTQALTLSLIGTVIEPGHSMAMFRKPAGGTVFCAVGESVDDAGGPVKVLGVDEDKVTVEFAGRTRELALPPKH